MRSRTSYFNRTLFLKTVTRFWPLWFFYAAVWVIVMPLMMGTNLRFGGSVTAMQSDVLAAAHTFGVMIGFVAACVAAMAVWSFMYSARSVSGMACLPIRREGVFFSVSLAGIAPLLAINVLIFLLSLGTQALYKAVDLSVMCQWLGAVTLELIFFYGFALLCAQLTGNLAVLPAVYLVLGFTGYAVNVVAGSLLSAFVYGAAGLYGPGSLGVTLSPALGILLYSHISAERVPNAAYEFYEITRYYLTGWGAMAIYAAVGIAFAALALWLYRRRRMESAGDVVAVGILKPVFKYCMTFGGALCIGALLYSMTISGGLSGRGVFGAVMFNGGAITLQWMALAAMILYMLIGAFIGYFASEMLIHKSFRVWRGGRRWLGLGVSALIIVALMLSAELDLFGYERRVPDPDSVESVYIAASGEGVTLTQPENIAAAVELHRSVVENKRHYEAITDFSTMYDKDNVDFDFSVKPNSMNLRVEYKLKNGSSFTRYYPSLRYYAGDPNSQTDARAAQKLLNTPEAIAYRKSTTVELNAETIFEASVNANILPRDVEKALETGEVYNDYGDRITAAGDGVYEYETESRKYAGLTTEEEAEMLPEPEFNASWSLTPEEALELYNECILPDMADGTIGTVWIIADEEYENTVYALRINIDARVPRTQFAVYGPGTPISSYYEYEYFYTVPTVNSVRTNRWLEEHGIILRTIAEAGEL